MRSLSAAILDVVANPRVAMFLADTSLLENMSWRKCSKVNSIARVITNRPALVIIDMRSVAPRPCPLILSLNLLVT